MTGEQNTYKCISKIPMKSLKRIDFDCSSSRVVVQGLGSIIHNLIYKGHTVNYLIYC